ncbi:hypothetical protein Gotur_032305 [Gossypium turneri]
MVFKDGEQFKITIHKYSKCCRRELKIIKNDPNRVKSFHDEHNCYVSFRNKMVNVKVIAKKIEATIRDHPKMKLREIQRRVALEMNVNVNMRRCRRAKKIVKDKLAGNFIEEFAMLWDYADELRLKNSESTINIVVNRVTPESPPHFKRFYVCFEALKRSGKEGCRPILGLDGCLLKGPFKGEILSTGECTDSWS